ncbi:MAG: uroporphyrinogen decarboxylase [Phycisphaerae bacterium]|nr:uroporphyrinogen decarboxylase [Phycisphaerae bacterium]
MTTSDYPQTAARFEEIVRNRRREDTMVALIIDSPWLPGYAEVNTLDFYFEVDVWLDVHRRVVRDLPGAAFVPGSWFEFGMAAEPSGWGVPIQWKQDGPPAVHRYAGTLDALVAANVPNPEADGLMPAILRRYEKTGPVLVKEGLSPRMAACRGPLAIASHLMGVTEFLMATQLEADKCLKLVDKITQFCIRWLRCQLAYMDQPFGVLVLDDVVGMLSPADAERFALPYLKAIFDAFGDLVHIYHNDTPNANMVKGLATIGMDVFNFSHLVDVAKARTDLGPDVVLMGNIPPLDVLVRGTAADVRQATRELLAKTQQYGPILISPGGGVSPETPIANLQAMLEQVGGC